MKARWRAIAAAIAIGALGAPGTAFAGEAGAMPLHENGKVELYVSEFDVQFHDDVHHVHALVVDQDSGTPASGFEVTVTAAGRGTTIGPVMLTSDGDGQYTGFVELEPGSWTLTVDAQQGASTIPAKASQRAFTVEIDGDMSVVASSAGSAWRTAILSGGAVGLVAVGGLVLRRRSRT